MNAVYSIASKTVIDVLNDQNVGHYCGDTLEQIRQRIPDAEVADLLVAKSRVERTHITNPQEISEEEYHELMGAVPVLHAWADCFMSSEMVSGSVTTICVNICGRFWRMQDFTRLTRDDILRRVQVHLVHEKERKEGADHWHCIGCEERLMGVKGSFIHAGDFIAVSPVFAGLLGLYDWMRGNGWMCVDQSTADMRVTRLAS